MQQDHVRRAVTEHVRARLQEETRAHGAKMKLAKALGCSPAHVTNILKGVVGCGDSFLRAIAAYWRTSVPELEAEALKAAPPQGVDRYPNRTLGLQLAAQMKKWPRAAIEEVARMPLPANDAAPPAYWVVLVYHRVQEYAAYESVRATPPAVAASRRR